MLAITSENGFGTKVSGKGIFINLAESGHNTTVAFDRNAKGAILLVKGKINLAILYKAVLIGVKGIVATEIDPDVFENARREDEITIVISDVNGQKYNGKEVSIYVS